MLLSTPTRRGSCHLPFCALADATKRLLVDAANTLICLQAICHLGAQGERGSGDDLQSSVAGEFRDLRTVTILKLRRQMVARMQWRDGGDECTHSLALSLSLSLCMCASLLCTCRCGILDSSMRRFKPWYVCV